MVPDTAFPLLSEVDVRFPPVASAWAGESESIRTVSEPIQHKRLSTSVDESSYCTEVESYTSSGHPYVVQRGIRIALIIILSVAPGQPSAVGLTYSSMAHGK